MLKKCILGFLRKINFNMLSGKMRKPKRGLYENIRRKRERIAGGSGERMRKPGEKGAPSAADFKAAARTAR
jgi:hypothetical protein